MIQKMFLGYALCALVFTLGCEGSEKPTAPAAEPKVEKKAEANPVEPAKPVESTEVEFDPRKPPAGFTSCHRNHCHRVGGGVASYQQVMEEVGATKLVGVPKRAPMPTAPEDVAAAPADAEVTASGLASRVLTPGDGETRPTGTSVVTVHYTGWTTDGKAFDSSVSRGKPASFPLNKVIPGWTEGVQLMSVGEERRFWIPGKLAYGDKPKRRGAPAGTLVFDVELLSIR